MVVKKYQFDVFYEKELALWRENVIYRGLPVQMFLYQNRYRYLEKKPSELSDLEILRGFTISGIYRGYTVFDASLMDQVLQNYDIHSVYDPCAGWGERMLCCSLHDVSYFGVDVNQKLCAGYSDMIHDLNLKDQKFVYADSSQYEPDDLYDAVITCPPYGDTEWYSDQGAENLSKEDFLQWWQQVVQQCLKASPKYFCFQINQKWKEDMLGIVLSNGFELIEELQYKNKRSSHFNRKNGVNSKKEYENMLVCKAV